MENKSKPVRKSAKKSNAKKSNAKKSSAKKSTAKKSTAKKSSAKKSSQTKDMVVSPPRRMTSYHDELINIISAKSPEPESMGASDKPAIILIHADWCGHCQRLMPAWDQMNDEIAKDAALANKIVFHKIESNDLPGKLDAINALLPEEGKVVVQGYPTMGDVRNKRFTMYAGERDPESLMRWVKTVAA